MPASNEDDRDVRGDVRAQIREFLGTRRARISPEQAGPPVYGGDRRRVSGLRREEVAALAGISSEYYVRLERGTATGVHRGPCSGTAARRGRAGTPARPHPHRRHHPHARLPASRAPGQADGAARAGLDDRTPAFVLNGRLDVLAANGLGSALYAPMYADPVRPPNTARFVFLDRRASEFFRDWDRVANDTVALLRAEAGRNPYDRGLSDLIGELSTRSDDFRVRWAAHNVRIHSTGVKLLHHPVVGDLDLPFESFPLAGDPNQSMVTYTAEPGSPSQDARNLLASGAATRGEVDTAETAIF